VLCVHADPMVDVLAEVGNRLDIPAFYVAFVLAPLASNASEVSMYMCVRVCECACVYVCDTVASVMAAPDVGCV
jgi:hypothetical protein